MVELQHLFSAGIGFDITGAYLVARGLLADPRELGRKATSYWGGNGHLLIPYAEDRVAGKIGMRSLVFGFILQASAYALILTFDTNFKPGPSAGIFAACAVAIPALGVLLWWRHVRAARERETVIEAARYDASAMTLRPLPAAGPLALAANRGKGIERREGEDDETLAKRAWGLDEVAPPEMFKSD